MALDIPVNARVSTNALLESKLNNIRDRSLGSSAVRAITDEIAQILAVEATQGQQHQGKIGLIVVLRSGLGMTDAFLSRLGPETDVVVYHIGMFREKYTLQPVEYYNKLPNNNTEVKRVYVVDPLIATGGTATAVIEILRDWGVEHITFVSMLTSKKGLEHAAKAWPEGTDFVVGAVDPELDPAGYIVPGVGDIGDRLFGTGLSQ